MQHVGQLDGNSIGDSGAKTLAEAHAAEAVSPAQQMQEAHHQEAQTDRASLPHWAQWQQNAKGIKLCAIKQYLPCRKMICSKPLEKIKLLQQDRGSRDDQNGSTAARCSESYMFSFFILLQLGNLHQCVFDQARRRLWKAS